MAANRVVPTPRLAGVWEPKTFGIMVPNVCHIRMNAAHPQTLAPCTQSKAGGLRERVLRSRALSPRLHAVEGER